MLFVYMCSDLDIADCGLQSVSYGRACVSVEKCLSGIMSDDCTVPRNRGFKKVYVCRAAVMQVFLCVANNLSLARGKK